jgi:N-acetylneuraminic acid mutarotase
LLIRNAGRLWANTVIHRKVLESANGFSTFQKKAMKRQHIIKYGLLWLACVMFLAQCRKVDDSQAVRTSTGPRPGSSDTSTQHANFGFCNTFICLSLNDEISTTWTQQPTDQYLSEGAATTVGPRVYMGGGFEEGDYSGGLNDVFVFDLENEKVEGLLKLSVPRSHLTATSTNTKVMFAGGKSENIYNRGNPELFDAVDVFDQITGARSVSKLSQPRANLTSASAGNKAYFIGGLINGGQSTTRVDIFDASNGSWSTMELPTPRANAGAVISGGQLYVAGGMDAAQPGKPIYSVDVLDLETGSWTMIEAPHAHPKASVVLAGGEIFIAGGDLQSNKFVDIYNPTSNTWTSAQLTDSRNNITIAMLNDQVVFIGGSYSSAIDIYDIAKKTWVRGFINLGVNGMMAGSWKNKALITGFKFDRGNSVGNVMFILRRP